MKNRQWKTVLVAAGFLAVSGWTALAADGQWIETESGWQYVKEDGQNARNSWEDIDGEWYHFNTDGYVQTGWQKVGNLRYHFEADGRLSEGWQCYTGDGSEQWYFYDKSGNAVIRWLNDGGKWYWFNGNGILSTEAVKTISGKKYYFHEDGSLLANEYSGFKYFDADGQPYEPGNVRAINDNEREIKIDEGLRDEIAEELNGLPKGWLRNFVDNGWTFVYCPEKEYYSSSRDSETGDRYYIRYKLDAIACELRFTSPEALKEGFGEYLFRKAKQEMRDLDFTTEMRVRMYEILEFTEVPERYSSDYGMLFGVLFSRYLNEDDRAEMEKKLGNVAWYMDRAIQCRGKDGKLIERK